MQRAEEDAEHTESLFASSSSRHGCSALMSLKSSFKPLLVDLTAWRKSEKVKSLVVCGGCAMIGTIGDEPIRISASINDNEPTKRNSCLFDSYFLFTFECFFELLSTINRMRPCNT